MMSNNKSKKKKLSGKSLNQKLEERKLQKATKKGLRIFHCEPHAHFPHACGATFTAKVGWVSCPNCVNPYCRWVNYKEPKKPYVS